MFRAPFQRGRTVHWYDCCGGASGSTKNSSGCLKTTYRLATCMHLLVRNDMPLVSGSHVHHLCPVT